MCRFKLCFIFDEAGDYKPVPYSKLTINGKRTAEYADRYFIPLNGYLLEVSHEDYLDHYRTVNHQEYIRKEARRVGEISLQAMVAPDDEIIWELYEDISEKVIAKMMAVSLHRAIAMLDSDDRQLIHMLYFDGQSERHCAEVFNKTRSSIFRWKLRILEKLKNKLTE